MKNARKPAARTASTNTKEISAMKNNYTHISVILDRSGSMESLRDDTIGGFNAFLTKQKSEPGLATLTLVQFDSQDPYEVIHHFKPIGLVPELDETTYVPRGGTPLLDAMGRGINDIEANLGKMQAAARPGKVLVVVVTDGQENQSREFSKKQIKEMVEAKTRKNGWEFLFLSSDLNAVEEAQAVGFAAQNSVLCERSAEGTREMWKTADCCTAGYRRDGKIAVPAKRPAPPKKK